MEFISALADVSAIWLIILSFIPLAIPLAILGGMVYGMYKLLGALPPVFEKMHELMHKVTAGADKVSQSIAAPFIAAYGLAAQLKSMLRGLSQLVKM
jgi:hypothetical protein